MEKVFGDCPYVELSDEQRRKIHEFLAQHGQGTILISPEDARKAQEVLGEILSVYGIAVKTSKMVPDGKMYMIRDAVRTELSWLGTGMLSLDCALGWSVIGPALKAKAPTITDGMIADLQRIREKLVTDVDYTLRYREGSPAEDAATVNAYLNAKLWDHTKQDRVEKSLAIDKRELDPITLKPYTADLEFRWLKAQVVELAKTWGNRDPLARPMWSCAAESLLRRWIPRAAAYYHGGTWIKMPAPEWLDRMLEGIWSERYDMITLEPVPIVRRRLDGTITGRITSNMPHMASICRYCGSVQPFGEKMVHQSSCIRNTTSTHARAVELSRRTPFTYEKCLELVDATQKLAAAFGRSFEGVLPHIEKMAAAYPMDELATAMATTAEKTADLDPDPWKTRQPMSPLLTKPCGPVLFTVDREYAGTWFDRLLWGFASLAGGAALGAGAFLGDLQASLVNLPGEEALWVGMGALMLLTASWPRYKQAREKGAARLNELVLPGPPKLPIRSHEGDQPPAKSACTCTEESGPQADCPGRPPKKESPTDVPAEDLLVIRRCKPDVKVTVTLGEAPGANEDGEPFSRKGSFKLPEVPLQGEELRNFAEGYLERIMLDAHRREMDFAILYGAKVLEDPLLPNLPAAEDYLRRVLLRRYV